MGFLLEWNWFFADNWLISSQILLNQFYSIFLLLIQEGWFASPVGDWTSIFNAIKSTPHIFLSFFVVWVLRSLRKFFQKEKKKSKRHRRKSYRSFNEKVKKMKKGCSSAGESERESVRVCVCCVENWIRSCCVRGLGSTAVQLHRADWWFDFVQLNATGPTGFCSKSID